jgi:hypothetical protein
VRQSKVTLGPSSLRSKPSRSKPSRSKAAAAVPRFHCAPAHCQRVGTGGLAGPYAAMDGGIRAYMDVLAAGPANPPVHAQARANPTLKAVAPSAVAPKSCCSKSHRSRSRRFKTATQKKDGARRRRLTSTRRLGESKPQIRKG